MRQVNCAVLIGEGGHFGEDGSEMGSFGRIYIVEFEGKIRRFGMIEFSNVKKLLC